MALVEGKKVAVGDVVGFKSDIEQYGTVVAIKNAPGRPSMDILVLENAEGFEGEYLQGTRTEELAANCW